MLPHEGSTINLEATTQRLHTIASGYRCLTFLGEPLVRSTFPTGCLSSRTVLCETNLCPDVYRLGLVKRRVYEYTPKCVFGLFIRVGPGQLLTRCMSHDDGLQIPKPEFLCAARTRTKIKDDKESVHADIENSLFVVCSHASASFLSDGRGRSKTSHGY